MFGIEWAKVVWSIISLILVFNRFKFSVLSQVTFYIHKTLLDGSVGKWNLYLDKLELTSWFVFILLNVEPYCILEYRLVDSKIIEC